MNIRSCIILYETSVFAGFCDTDQSLTAVLLEGVVAIDVEAFCQTVAEMHDIKEQAIYLAQRLGWDMSSLTMMIKYAALGWVWVQHV